MFQIGLARRSRDADVVCSPCLAPTPAPQCAAHVSKYTHIPMRDQVFHDEAGRFDFVVMSKRGWVNPELAAMLADPDTQLIPFFERMAPAALGPLGKAHSVTASTTSEELQVKTFKCFRRRKERALHARNRPWRQEMSVHWSSTQH